MQRALAGFVLAGLVMALAVAGASAGERTGYVTAESRYGSATISGPVRRAGGHYEVRLPGGTWIDCHLSCSEALRRETIDFWQNHNSQRDGQGPDGPGYFLWRR